MPESSSISPKAKLSAKQKLMIAGLLCLQIPSGAVCYPIATIIILTGVGAPLSKVLWAVGTMPFSLAMAHKAAWQYGGERNVDDGEHPRAVTDHP
jgi:hypothetical protein